MTSFQDSPPPSRRAARQNERSGTTEAETGAFPSTDDLWDAASRDAAPFPPAAQPAADVPPAVPSGLGSGRRSAAPAPRADVPAESQPPQAAAPATPEPLRRSRNTPSRTAAPSDDLPPTQAIPRADQPQYRYGDHSPETQQPAAAKPVEAQPTQQQPAASQPEVPTAERTLTRRELRALQQQREEPPALQEPPTVALPIFSAAPTTPEELATQQQSEGEPAEQQTDGADTSTADVFPLFSSAPIDERVDEHRDQSVASAGIDVQDAENPTSIPTAWPFGPTEPVAAASAPEPEPEPEPSPEPTVESMPTTADDFAFPLVAPEPAANTNLTAVLAEFDYLTSDPAQVPKPVEAAPEPSDFDVPLTPASPGQYLQAQPEAEPATPVAAPQPEPVSAWTPPPGHWSHQLDDEDDVQETTVNRTIGSGSVATSALVLPSIPEPSISGPLSSSGEIILTGSIDLPQTLSATGSSSRLEHSGIDHLFETHDAEVVSTESSPVSAVNAISTRSGSGLGNAPKQQGTRALTALIVAAAVMGVVVIGLLVTALALNVF